ncbi:hypothetical protein PROFUN_00879 [Planoprotostelium fungivorum]|uniref:Ras guanine nucleotide exchange factor n=1 Tax=Planoprotostelium fungivorum TaxID=1890364 RepID=A0A2P6P076_9EUKA|nr:hypothetical protein PROFUN_00879 [Planoprotostelium fungivorum]
MTDLTSTDARLRLRIVVATVFIAAAAVSTWSIMRYLKKVAAEQQRIEKEEREEEVKKEIERQTTLKQEEEQKVRVAKNVESMRRKMQVEHVQWKTLTYNSGSTTHKTTYPFDVKDTRDTIQYTTDENTGVISIKAATIFKLIEKLTEESGKGLILTSSFLLTYRSFITPIELFDILILRYHVPLHHLHLEDDERNEKFRRHIHLRVWYVLKYWVEHFFFDFQEEHLLKRLMDFVDVILSVDEPGPATQMRAFIQKQREMRKNTHVMTSQRLPEPYVPDVPAEHLKLLDISPVEIARQMTLSEYAVFKRIQPSECLDQSWSKEGDVRAPRIVSLIDRFNRCNRWVISEIVREEDVHKRALIITHFIRTSIECKLLNNFNSMMGIVSGLLNSSVSRLKHSWNLVPSDLSRTFESTFSHMFHRNFKVIRDAVKQANPPCLPYVGIYLADLTFIEDGNVNMLHHGRLINFEKRLMIARVIGDIRIYQQKSYQLAPVYIVADFIERCLSGQTLHIMDEREAHVKSLQIEPRGS